MNVSTFLEVLKDLNGGSVIPNKSDELSFHSIGSEKIKLYVGEGNKHYYFCDYFKKEKVDNMSEIEKTILYNDKDNEIVKPESRYSYLILFYKVEAIDDSILKKVIELEEDEYFYKKYVFYYTEKQLELFMSWYSTQDNKTVSDLINSPEIINDIESEHIRFLLRLLVKIPFVKFDFKKVELKDYDSILNSNISRMRNKEKIFNLNQVICDLIFTKDCSIDEAVNELYRSEVGE